MINESKSNEKSQEILYKYFKKNKICRIYIFQDISWKFFCKMTFTIQLVFREISSCKKHLTRKLKLNPFKSLQRINLTIHCLLNAAPRDCFLISNAPLVLKKLERRPIVGIACSPKKDGFKCVRSWLEVVLRSY